MEENKVIAERIKALAAQKGMNYEKIAVACNEPPKRMYRIMCGGTSWQSVIILIKICKALGVSLDEFFDTEEFKDLF